MQFDEVAYLVTALLSGNRGVDQYKNLRGKTVVETFNFH